jgi:hypothetical protein
VESVKEGKRGHLPLPPPAALVGPKRECFVRFEKNSIFLANNIFCPSPGPMWEKFVDTHYWKKNLVRNPIIVFFLISLLFRTGVGNYFLSTGHIAS